MFQLLSILSFLLRLQYKVFHSINLHSHSVCSCLHPCIFFNFFETLKYQFHKKLKKGLQGAWAPKRFSEGSGTSMTCIYTIHLSWFVTLPAQGEARHVMPIDSVSLWELIGCFGLSDNGKTTSTRPFFAEMYIRTYVLARVQPADKTQTK
jgi:hypothetical protein